MKVHNLHVDGFRNLREFDVTPCEGVNIISGENAQGKTNLLEAIWLFTGARSFRGARDREFLREGCETASLTLDFFAEGREQSAILRYGAEKRAVELNGVKQERPSSLGGVFCAVVFSPDNMSLIKNGPELRRRMIDTSLFQAYPKYVRALDNYSKALKQRNALLKDISRHPMLSDMLDIWDKHICEYGGYISKLRAGYIKTLTARSLPIYNGISSGKETLDLAYLPGFEGAPEGFTVGDYQTAIKEALTKNRENDIRLGITSAGPHRDDLDIRIDGKSARTFGSQGQQRSCILALKLAECSILEERCGEAPVVMLDDVMSELDKHRRSYLLNQLENRQIFITCCDDDAVAPLRQGRMFHMEQGMISTQ